MVTIIIDTSVLIEEIRRGCKLWQEIKEESKLGEVRLVAPSIVLTELWAGKKMGDKQNMIRIEKLIKPIKFVDIDKKLAKEAGEVIRRWEVSGFDAVIAATALVHKARLATLNRKHFEKMEGLKMYNRV